MATLPLQYRSPAWAVAGAGLVLAGLLTVVALDVAPRSGPQAEIMELDAPSAIADALNLLLVPDAADYRGSAGRGFQIQALALVTGVRRNNVFGANSPRFNYWFAEQAVSVQAPKTSRRCPRPNLAPLGRAVHDFDVVLVLHGRQFFDCRMGNVATSEIDEFGTVLHELGHAAFGLPDEWGRGRLRRAEPVIFIGASEVDCTARVDELNRVAAPSVPRACGSVGGPVTTAAGVSRYYRAEELPDSMTSAGDRVTLFGPADWHYIRAGLRRRLPGRPTFDPTYWPAPASP